VPLLIISPWTKGGKVYSEVSDHTSLIKLVERRFGIHNPNISAWRRAMMSDMTHAFDFANPDYTIPTGLPDTSGNPDQSSWQCNHNPPPTIPATQSMPSQETGTKKAMPLP